uniref:Protein FRA10AC1 n=1 Tax=Timema bartmani TaxID=61472 RepID=A0A7R9EQJ7_9NEOP|nr:unnamed protein product [Timema bartmani]
MLQHCEGLSRSSQIEPSLSSLSTYDLHKRLINEYILCRKGSTSTLKRNTSQDKCDIDVIRENHRFLWNEEDSADTWETRLAKKYYDKLFKEYCICDLSHYKENKVAMRWRTEQEVVIGKGQFGCGEKHCTEASGLRSWEVNFGYREQGEKRNALVKVRLCSGCSDKLNHHHKRKEVGRAKSKKRRSDSVHEDIKKRKVSDALEKSEAEESNTEEKGDEEEQEEGKAWRENSEAAEEKSRDDEFQDYLEELLL